MKRKFECEYCEQEFYDEILCEKHELIHELDTLIKTLPDDAIVCPACNGEGGFEGNDGCDFRCCNTCGGKRFVIPQTTYKRIE